MTDNKLTLQDIMLYNNAILLYDKSNISNISFDKNLATGIGKVNIIRFHDGQIQLIDNNIIVWTEPANCKLILRDLTQLTDEELQHIIKIYEDEPNEFIEIENKLDRIYLLDVKKHDYLRSKNILIEPEDWFAIGKAVRE